jgi:hypothetical protein
MNSERARRTSQTYVNGWITVFALSLLATSTIACLYILTGSPPEAGTATAYSPRLKLGPLGCLVPIPPRRPGPISPLPGHFSSGFASQPVAGRALSVVGKPPSQSPSTPGYERQFRSDSLKSLSSRIFR